MLVYSSQKPGVMAVRVRRSNRSAAKPTSSASSRLAVSSKGSPSTSHVPAGISSSHRSTAGRYWRHSTTVRASVTATTATAPGWRTMSRSKGTPSGSRNVARCTRMNQPWWTVSSPVGVKTGSSVPGASPASADGTDVDQMGVPTLRPGQGGADQPLEQRVGLIGAALELGMGLGAHPVRVTRQLDELDEATVGRDTRANQPGFFEALAVAGVHFVAVAVPLGHDHVAIGPGHLRVGQEPGIVRAEAHGPALVGHVDLIVHQVDHRVAGGGLELARVGSLQPGQ